jgi:hypothetical protein
VCHLCRVFQHILNRGNVLREAIKVSNIMCVFLKRDTNAAINKSSATAHVQEDSKVALLTEIRNVAGDAQEVVRVVLK